MSSQSETNKRIAKNTILLYIRMFVTMFVNLFTSRIILDVLGVEDFGIYNLIGGFVAMFAIVRSGLVSSTQRFLTYDLGKNDIVSLNRTFSTITIIYIFLCSIIFILSESFGIWFIDNKLVIPDDRLGAAKWVFQFSVISLIANLLSSPYNALIIAHEKMEAFAYITIYEVIAKLIVTCLLYIVNVDKLIVYAVLQCIVQVTVPILYWCYCQKNYKAEVRIKWKFDVKKVGEIYAFAGWSMMGGFAYMGYTQGLTILLGAFFNPVVNAARGIAVQVQSIVMQFVSNFQVAMGPQIVKSFAIGDTDYMVKLVNTSSKFSFLLLYVISLPIMLEADTLLGWWLVEVPENTILFLRLIIITTMFDAISNPYEKAIHATGKIRNYHIICSVVLLLIVPFSYALLKLGGAPYTVFIVHIFFSFIAMVCRIRMALNILKVPTITFVNMTLKPILIVLVISLLASLGIVILLPEGIFRLLMVVFVSLFSIIVSIFSYGLNADEKVIVVSRIKGFKNKLFDK